MLIHCTSDLLNFSLMNFTVCLHITFGQWRIDFTTFYLIFHNKLSGDLNKCPELE